MNAGTIEVKLTRPELVLICEALTEYMRMYMRMNNRDGVCASKCASKRAEIEPLLNRLINYHLDYQFARDKALETLMGEFVEGVRRLLSR